jgi:hypothetical protein
MPFSCGKRVQAYASFSARRILNVFRRITPFFFEPTALHLQASPFSRNEGLLGQTPSPHSLLAFCCHRRSAAAICLL